MSTLSVCERPVFRLPPYLYIYDFEYKERVQYVSNYKLLNLLWFEYDICMYLKYVHFGQSCVLAYTTLFYICIYDIYYLRILHRYNNKYCSLVREKTFLPRLKRNAHFARINCSNCLFSVFSLPHVGFLSIWPLISNIVNHLLNELHQTLY